jgi:hypothetical protein
LNVEPIKIANCLAAAADDHAHIAPFCFANRAAHWAVEAFLQFINRASQIQCVPVECCSRIRGDLKEFAAANFKMSPSTFLRETHDPISYQIDGGWIKDEWLACIAEWEADAATASERTAHFHHRYQRRQSTALGKPEVKRVVVVSLMKHLCPGTRVKATGVAMQGDQMIPAWVANGIANSHFQRFLVRLRLYQGILAGKGSRFDGSCCVWLESFQEISSRRELPHQPLH